MVYHSVGVHAQARGAASSDGCAKVCAAAHASLEAIRHGLIGKVPRVEIVRKRLQRHHLFLCRVQLDAHVPHLSKDGTLLGNVSVRPHKELDNLVGGKENI